MCLHQSTTDISQLFLFENDPLQADIDLKRFWDAIRVSSGTSFSWETAAPFIFNQNYETDFTIDLFCKDFKLGTHNSRGFAPFLNILIGLREQKTSSVQQCSYFSFGTRINTNVTKY